MSENLDSRALRNFDCYGQRFMRPGTYPYALVPAGSVGASDSYPYLDRRRREVDRNAARATSSRRRSPSAS